MAKRFESDFAAAVGGKFALAVNSCTAAMHVAIDAVGLRQGQGVLVPTMTFAATAEVVRYFDAVPILVDCDPASANMDLADAERKLEMARTGKLGIATSGPIEVVGVVPVHVGGFMLDMDAVHALARRHKLWVIEDAAHAFPASWRAAADRPWQRCGENSSAVSCFSFYANKTITTGEGGMAVTDDKALADRMRMMSLHGLSHDAWERYSGGRSWDYQIVEAGYKYNITDVAAAIGVHQLARAEEMRAQREAIARVYLAGMADIDPIELPVTSPDRIHSWHLFPIRLCLERLSIDRNVFVDELRAAGVGCSVHWRPLHLHPYYRDRFGWKAELLPAATRLWERVISLPLFPDMQDKERDYVMAVVRDLCARHRA
jgi:perosamine synthetase